MDQRKRRAKNHHDSKSKALTLAAMSLGFVVVQLDVSIVNVALQSISSAMGGGVAGLQWVVNAYTIVFAALILTAGAAGDRFGAKRVFMAGFGIFVAASLGCALAPNLALLLASRALQGLGAAILVPCSLALLNHAYTEDAERTSAIGIWAAGASAALAAGPVVGGLLIAVIGWRSIFFINVPIGIAGIWLTWRYAMETTQTKTRHIDFPGQFLAIFALAGLAAATIEGGTAGWTNPWILGAYVLCAAAIAAFIWVESKKKSPMLPLQMFSNRTFTATTALGLFINIAFYGLIFVLSLFFQQIQKFSALKTGLAFLPMMIVLLIVNVLAGRISEKFGARRAMLFGQLLFAAGCLALLNITSNIHYMLIAAQMLAIGAGIGITVPPMTSVLLGTAEKERSGIASGVLNSSRQAGSVIGVALFGSLIAQKEHFVHGTRIALLISAASVLIGFGLALLVEEKQKSAAKSSSHAHHSREKTSTQHQEA